MQILQFSVYFKNEFVSDFFLVLSEFASSFVVSASVECDDIHLINDVSEGFPLKRYKITMDGYLCSLFYYVLKTSIHYRKLIIKKLLSSVNSKGNCPVKCFIKIKLIYPDREIIDYRGNEMFEVLCLERRELDSAMAWFSTLGGAFSALGDGFENCAIMAGKISIKQFQIAWKLGDPYLMARCKLYLALSFIQRHNFKRAKEIIKEQYIFASKGPIQDHKLFSMCKGIWTKLRYDKSQYKIKKKKNNLDNKFQNDLILL